MRPAMLWRARNDWVARRLFDPTDRSRHAWIKLARDRARAQGASADFIVRRGGDKVSFLLLGDTGEGDASQYSLTTALAAHSADVDFAFICSDVIYPTGDIGDYADKFYRPYRNLMVPIYAVPGNHDWYDSLHGFMHHICGLDGPGTPIGGGGRRRRALEALLWRRSPGASRSELQDMAELRSDPRQKAASPQPAPYFAIDAGPLRLVGIDTGIRGRIDAVQGEWLKRVSFEDPRPKILLTGKPLIVDNKYHPGPIAHSTETIDSIVRDPRANYIAAIGGDIHNYQRYPVTLPDGRVIQYVVSGGGGAFMHATHQIGVVDIPGTSEQEFRCYPLRGDSLARYSEIYDRQMGRGLGKLKLSPTEAASYMAERLKLPTTRGKTQVLSRRARRAGRLIQPLPAQRGFQRFVSELFNWDDPPMFKQFLRVDVTPRGVQIRCFGVSGCASTEASPPVEDDFTISF
jgi:hypothetical protein